MQFQFQKNPNGGRLRFDTMQLCRLVPNVPFAYVLCQLRKNLCCGLVGCDIMRFGKWVPQFCRSIMPPILKHHRYTDYIIVRSSSLYNQTAAVEALAEQFKYSNVELLYKES